MVFALELSLLGCGAPVAEEPAPVVQPASVVNPRPAPPAGDLQEMIDRTLQHIEHQRVMSLQQHAAWQLLHGVLAFGEKFEILAEGRPVAAVDWVFDGKPMKGWTINPTPQGLRAEIEAGKLGQGHDDQWLAILSQWNVPTNRPIRVAGKDYTLHDLVKRTMYDCFEGKEGSWTIIALSKHLRPIDQTWIATDKQQWSLERLVSMEAGPVYDEAAGQELILSGACGGTHRLIGLAIALNNYRALHPNVELAGGWLAASKRIEWAVARAEENQLPSGAFSIAFFFRPANSNNIDEHLAATGHVLEFLSFALPKERLDDAWIQRAVVYLCGLLDRTRHIDLECGALYHAAHGLVLYREKVFGPRPGGTRPDAAAAGLATAGS
ncbi:MAG: ADP-ribosylation factor-directed GTPase activating protein isoform b [Planctomycetota bacterium]|nr:MAG: ADP-ribosylation factor-directed GTPase activating protein isoform b [Planctomycetota bacterium]